MSHNMLTALTTRLTGACLLIVLSGHTNADYTEEEIREAAIWIDSMTTEIAQVNTTYKVQELKCYSKNITPSTSPKFFSLVTAASKYLQAVFGKALESPPTSHCQFCIEHDSSSSALTTLHGTCYIRNTIVFNICIVFG